MTVSTMLAGVLVGLVCIRLRANRLHRVLWILMSLGFGLLGTWLGGEYLESWAFVLLDSTYVAGISLAFQLAYRGFRKEGLPLE